VDEKVDPATILRRRRLELARVDILRQLQMVRSEVHKEMLERALAALEQELGELPVRTE
jgi:hypothetical protein